MRSGACCAKLGKLVVGGDLDMVRIFADFSYFDCPFADSVQEVAFVSQNRLQSIHTQKLNLRERKCIIGSAVA